MNPSQLTSWMLSGVLALAALPAIAQQRQPNEQPNLVTYECANNSILRVEFTDERARIRTDLGLSLSLRQVQSASGARYSNGVVTLDTQGNRATVDAAGRRIYDRCVVREGERAPTATQPSRPPGTQINARYNCDSNSRDYPDRRNVDAREAERLVLQRENGQFVYRCVLTRAEMASVTGVVTYRQRIALPNNATVEVELQDVSRQDAPAIAIARDRIETNGRQVPIPFELSYNPEEINTRNTYVVRARIVVDGRDRWITTRSYPVITRNNPTQDVEILVEQVRN